jgi:EpsI family protein
MMNYTVLREGNIIQLPHITLSIVEACSGLRSLVALTFLAATASYFVLKSNWKRLILILCAFPIAIMLNWARITGTVLLANHWGEEAALGFFHGFSGLIIFAVATILISFIMLFLRSKEEQATPSQTSDLVTPSTGGSMKLSALIVSSVLLITLSFYGNFLFSLKPGSPVDLRELSLKIGHFVGKDIPLDSEITEFSDVTQDRSISFYDPNNPPIDLYLGYYRTGRESRGFFHGPDVCLPGSGWKIIKKEKLALKLTGYENSQVEVLRYVSIKEEVAMVMITWIQAGRLVGTGSRKMRVKLVWETILNLHYNDATKVMVQTTIAPQESEDAATKRLIQFIDLFYPRFMDMVV